MDYIKIKGREIKKEILKSIFTVVPIGSLEYHGEHSPQGTDSLLAEHFSKYIEKEYDCILMPLIAYTACPGKTYNYPGTISIKPETMISYLNDIFESLVKNGIKDILVLNAHDGNMSTVRSSGEYITGKYEDVSLLIINWWQLVSDEFIKEKNLFDGDIGKGHGGPYEMSAVKAIDESSVEVIKEDVDLHTIKINSKIPNVCIESIPKGWNGYTGLISRISSESGRLIIEEGEKNLKALIDQWIKYREEI